MSTASSASVGSSLAGLGGFPILGQRDRVHRKDVDKVILLQGRDNRSFGQFDRDRDATAVSLVLVLHPGIYRFGAVTNNCKLTFI